MIPSAAIELSLATEPICGPVTKFGGQPYWLEEPWWPLSRSTRTLMDFICQIALADVPGLPENVRSSGRMAYIFMTSGVVEGAATFDPEGGENAVIIQPGGRELEIPFFQQSTNEDVNTECSVRLSRREEPEFIDPETGLLGFTIDNRTAHVDEATRELLRENKLGGVPSFWQACEYPPLGGPWFPLLQLNDYNDLGDNEFFNVNFGSGRGFAFVSADGAEGRLLWQC